MLRPVRVTPPAARPVSVAEARAHLRVDDAGEEALITGLVEAAVSHLDGWTGTLGRCLVTQTWRQDFPAWWGSMRLPFPDVGSVAVTYRDLLGAEATVLADDHRIEDSCGTTYVSFRQGWLAPSLVTGGAPAVSVTFTAGFGAPEDVPAAIKQAILMLIGHWYANREAVGPGTTAALPLAVTALLAPWRVVRL